MSRPCWTSAVFALGATLTIGAAIPAFASCPFPALNLPNNAYQILFPDHYGEMQVSRPYWIAVGAIPNDPTHDYDISVYSFSGGGAEPQCLSGLLATSAAGAGRTDFVVGDFNHDPYGNYWTWCHCYSGACDNNVFRGIRTWRDGGTVLTVDGTALTVPVAISDYPEQIVHPYDVFLVAGVTYYLRFQTTGDLQTKLCLFRNPANGVYWAGRSSAVLETAACTTYVAPASGYYGLVAVQDARAATDASYTVGVTTTPACNCAKPLVSDVPVTIPGAVSSSHHLMTEGYYSWIAAGVRSNSDWDLTAGSTAAGPPNRGCLQGIDALSTLIGQADLVVGDYTNATASPDQYTEAVRVSRYSGTDPATLQMHELAEYLEPNWYSKSVTLGADDVVRSYDAPLVAGTPYTLVFNPGAANQSLLVFENTTGALAWRGRPDAAMHTTGTAIYTPSVTSVHALVVVKDDAQAAGFSLRFGLCDPPVTLLPRVAALPTGRAQNYFRLAQTDTSWAAVEVHAAGADWDLRQYGQVSGSAWPDCFGQPGAVSENSNLTDFVVGDFHHNPLGDQFVRAYEFTPNTPSNSGTEWDPGSGKLTVNAATTSVGPILDPVAERLWCYEVRLQVGVPYTMEFASAGAGDFQRFVFGNSGGSSYWAPRSAALLSGQLDQPFTPTTTGWYGVVVVNDNDSGGNFALRVSSTIVGVDDRPAIAAVTGLREITPNPTRGPLRIVFSITSPGPADFDVLDLAGRSVARLQATSAASGRGELVWDGLGRGGEALPAGIYLVRMSVRGRSVETRRVALVR
jgi:FlgD Ig-like domain